MSEQDVDIRLMTGLKNELFESEELIDNHLVTRSEWDVAKKKLKIEFSGKIEELILKEIQSNNGLINLEKFMDILDLFQVVPQKKSKVKNQSKDIYMCLSGNTRDMYNTDQG